MSQEKNSNQMIVLVVNLVILLMMWAVISIQQDKILTEVQEVRDDYKALITRHDMTLDQLQQAQRLLESIEGQTYGVQTAAKQKAEEKQQLQQGLVAAQRTIDESSHLPDLDIAEVRDDLLYLNQANVKADDVVFLAALNGDQVIANLKNKSMHGHDGTKLPAGADQVFLLLSQSYQDETGSGYRPVAKQVIRVK